MCSSDLRVRTRSPRLGAVLWWLHDVVSGRGAAIAEHGVSVHRVSDVPAAVRRLLRRGDVVVMNSMRLLDLRRTARFAAAASAEVVWYLREAAALDHAATLVGSVDRVLANSRPLAERYTSITALPCAYVPSVIDVDPLVAPSGEGCILLVNAVPSYGQAEAIAIAAAMPHRHVVLQESWPIGSIDGVRCRA
mgnify:FL=1